MRPTVLAEGAPSLGWAVWVARALAGQRWAEQRRTDLREGLVAALSSVEAAEQRCAAEGMAVPACSAQMVAAGIAACMASAGGLDVAAFEQGADSQAVGIVALAVLVGTDYRASGHMTLQATPVKPDFCHGLFVSVVAGCEVVEAVMVDP